MTKTDTKSVSLVCEKDIGKQLLKFLNITKRQGKVKMKTREPDKAVKFISRLCADGEKVIESEYFEGVNYLIKDDHIVILAGRHGELAVDMNKVFSLTKEINEICTFWGNIDTEKCLTSKEERKKKAV